MGIVLRGASNNACDFRKILMSGPSACIVAIREPRLCVDEKVELGRLAIKEGILGSLLISTRHTFEERAFDQATSETLGGDWAYLPIMGEYGRLAVYDAAKEEKFLEAFYRELGRIALSGRGRVDRSEVCTPLSELDGKTAERVREAFPKAADADLFITRAGGRLWAVRWPVSGGYELRHLACIDERKWVWPDRPPFTSEEMTPRNYNGAAMPG